MKLNKHLESLNEVLDELHSALDDPRGVEYHQRRVAMMLSIGICDLVEIYFHKLDLIKSGSRIKHDWFKQKKVKEKLEQQIICSIDSIKNIDRLISLANSIEESRDNLAYGVPEDHEKMLLEKINQFFEMKKIIEQEVGILNG